MRPASSYLLAITAALTHAACTDPTFHAKAEVLEDVRTVIEVSWEPMGGGEGWVEFGPTSAYGHSTPPVPDGEGRSRALLLGNKPFQDVHWRVVASADGRTVEGSERVTTTQGVAPALPDFHLDHSDGSFDGYVLGVSWAEVAYLYIIDADADLVWYSALPMGTVSLSVDPVAGAQALRFLRVGMDHGLDQSVAITQGMDGIDREEIPTDQGHHSMVSHADGRIAWLAIDVQEYKDFGELVGDRVMTWDPAGGETRQLYSTWDHLLYDPDNTLETNFYPQGIDWTHTNTITHAPTRGSYWLTMGGVDSLVEIDEVSGEPLTIVGTDGYHFDPPLDAFGDGFGPHAASWTPDDTLLVFDNNDATVEGPSRVLEFELDDQAGAATEIWRYEGAPGMVAMVLGGCDRLDTGETFIHWGTTGHLQVVDEQGGLIWSARQQSIVADATVIRDLYGR
jgi:hypothetical protein